MPSNLNDRQLKIVEMLKIDGEVKISDLKALFQVADMTIRRDLEKLERGGEAKRTYGGAILTTFKDPGWTERSTVRIAEKERIGRYAASLVKTGESIFIDSGSTTLQVVRHLPYQAQINVVTNAIHIAAELSEKKIPTIVIGGMLMDSTNSMVGSMTVDMLSRMAFDKAFLGTTGLSAPHGFSNSNMHEAEIKRNAISRAKETYIVMDRSKFGASALFSFASLADVHSVVTDGHPDDPELAEACEEAGTALLFA